jgi:hypothetical protein
MNQGINTDHKFDQVLLLLDKIESKLGKVVTTKEFNEAAEKIFTILDQQSAILQRLDQERIFTYEWIKGIENNLAEKERGIK